MAFGFFRGALPPAVGQQGETGIAAPHVPVDTSPWAVQRAPRDDIWPRGIRLSLLLGLALAGWGIVLATGYALRSVLP